MLKLIEISSNKKTGPIATTYRSGEHQTYSTCPKSCALHPSSEKGADSIDREYLEALLEAVPPKGKAWTYSHFNHKALPKAKAGQTVINASCDSVQSAIDAVKAGHPAVYAAAKESENTWPKKIDGVVFARCPAELSEKFNCNDCGNGSPLCARPNREFVVVFVAHGKGQKLVGTGKGGCYAATGPTAIHWNNTKKNTEQRVTDAVAIKAFAKSLRRGSYLRHHIAGDIGKEII